jgi:hypothetical protein
MKTTAEVSPLKSAAEEVDFLSHLFRSTVEAYAARVEGDLRQIRATITAEARSKQGAVAKFRDARDIITLVRTLEIKPEKGRRKELKKIESVVKDLLKVVESWDSRRKG